MASLLKKDRSRIRIINRWLKRELEAKFAKQYIGMLKANKYINNYDKSIES